MELCNLACHFQANPQSHFLPDNLVDVLLDASFLLSGFFFSVGLGPVPFVLIAELFPIHHRGVCTSIVLTVRYPVFQPNK